MEVSTCVILWKTNVDRCARPILTSPEMRVRGITKNVAFRDHFHAGFLIGYTPGSRGFGNRFRCTPHVKSLFTNAGFPQKTVDTLLIALRLLSRPACRDLYG